MTFDDVGRAVRDGHAALAADPDGSLPLSNRRQIWSAFGPVERDGARAVVTDALRRRVALAELAVRRVLPTWEAALPGDGRATEMLDAARQYLAGTLEFGAASSAKHRFWGHDEGLIGGPAMNALYVGYAAAGVVTVALRDQPGAAPGDVPPGTRDEDLDPYQWDASFYAAAAAAGEVPGEDGSDPARCRAFWAWYLDEAVPQTWQAVTMHIAV